MGRLVDEEQAAKQENQITARKAALLEHVKMEKRFRQVRQPVQTQQEQDARAHRQSQPHLARFGLLFHRQAAGHDGDEDDEDNGNNDGGSSDGESSEEKKQQKGRSTAAAGVGGSVGGSSSASSSGSSSRRREESEPTQTEIHSVFIGNLLPNISREELSDLVKKIEEPTQVRILMQDRNGRKVAVAFLDFTKASTVNTIVKKFNNSDFKGRKLQVRPANDRKLAPAPVSSESVYIRNLSFETTEDTLRKLFSPFGEILQIRLPVFADSGKHRGYGFIDYKDSSSAKKALKLDRKKVDGRPIIVEPAEKREAQKVDSLRKSDWEGEHLSFDD